MSTNRLIGAEAEYLLRPSIRWELPTAPTRQSDSCAEAIALAAARDFADYARIRGKGNRGSDDWRNGLPLCSTHHVAFDGLLFGVEPDSHAIRCKPGLEARLLGLRTVKLEPLKNRPHVDALSWRWALTKRAWDTAIAEQKGAI